MEDPIREIPHVVNALVTSPPSIQRELIRKYFTPDASFTHPLCRTGSWSGSRSLIEYIYRWYKIMSPTIYLEVKSVALDPKTQTLYLSIHQNFHIWFLPFWTASVNLTTVLQLRRIQTPPSSSSSSSASAKYLIASQNDLYQTDQWVRFVLPHGVGSSIVVFWNFVATLGCMLGGFLLWPVSLWEEGRQGGQREVWSRELKILEWNEGGNGKAD